MMTRTRSRFAPSFLLAAALLTLPASAAPARAGDGPLKVFVLAGQSNMQGHAHVRTLEVLALDPRTAPILEEILGPDGTPRVCEDVWISSIGSSAEEKHGKLTVGFGAEARGPKIGPELTFGIYMSKLLGEPILIVKTAWGGKSLHTDFRPPSAGPFVFDEAQLERFAAQGKDLEEIRAEKAEATGLSYRLMIEHIEKVLADIPRVYPDHDAERGYELAGFVWFQGWNDMVDGSAYPRRGEPGGYDAYSEVLAHFIRDVRKDLEAPELPFVIGVLGVGGPVAEYAPDQKRYEDIHQSFRSAMAAPALLPEFEDDVSTVLTERYWDRELTALRRREQALRPALRKIDDEVEAGERSREEARAAKEALLEKEFTPRERTLLEKGASNAEYHYLGSAKILAEIGKGFAEALFEMRGPDKR